MSQLLNEDEDWLYLRTYLHDNSDSYSQWELDEKGELKYPEFIQVAEHYAFYEITVTYKINKHTGKVEYLTYE